METYRAYKETIAGGKLAEVIDLPEELKASELEILILPVKKKQKRKKEPAINLDDLPTHHMGKVLSPLDRDSIYLNER